MELLTGFLLFVSFVSLVAAAAHLAAPETPDSVRAAQEAELGVSLNPENKERFAFLAAVLTVPLTLPLAFLLGRKLSARMAGGRFETLLLPFVVALSAIYGAHLVRLRAEESLLQTFNTANAVLLLISILLAACVALRPAVSFASESKAAPWIGWICCALFSVMVAAAALAPVVHGFHFSIVAYDVSQTSQGAFLYHQYGNYSKFLAPVFSLTGISVASILSVFDGMIFLQITAILAAVCLALRRKWLIFPFTGAYLALEYCFNSHAATYFQYLPVRTFWPVLGFCAAVWFSRTRRKTAASVLCGVVAAIAFYWNFDSGTCAAGALAATVLLDSAEFRWRPRVAWGPVFGFAAAFLAVFLLIWIWFSLWLGEPYSFAQAFYYQSLFYQTGYYALPMPAPLAGLWPPFLLVFGAGLFLGVSTWLSGRRPGRTDLLLIYAATLGIGLFSYYQGRSHVYCLFGCVWPAAIVLTLLADRMLARPPEGWRMRLALFLTLAPLFAVASQALEGRKFLRVAPEAFRFDLENHVLFGRRFIVDWHPEILARQVEFLKRNLAGRNELTIASPHIQNLVLNDGLLFAEGNFRSAIPEYNSVEMIVSGQKREIERKIAEARAPLALLLSLTSRDSVPDYVAANYDLKDVLRFGDYNREYVLCFFEPKRGAGAAENEKVGAPEIRNGGSNAESARGK